ncbi:CDP-alcohol phosphatidyltransferase family protein [Specibacter cremeus]|uniref:CDP-alcohol phosphatidyltransferase family protein n=1 Tax=Specibacter cremeus TaxID=1629051 RepID=UPI000F7B93A0|nr:CDP-alcohol phosphatidyltransferase family protein [Specibacter cremeus]
MPAGPDASAAPSRAIFTVPNIITVVRFCGVPLFVWLVAGRQEYGWGVVVLALMGGTDWIDGFVARKFHQTSVLGRILDPLADRAALITVAITLVVTGIAPLWLLLLLVIPDAVLLVTSLSLFHWHPDLPVSRIGKTRTATLLIGTPMLLLAKALDSQFTTTLAWVFLLVGMACHLVAAYNYFVAILRKHREVTA